MNSHLTANRVSDLIMGTGYVLQSRQEPSLRNHHAPEATSSVTNEASKKSLKFYVCYIKFKARSYVFGRKDSSGILLCTSLLRERSDPLLHCSN